MWSPTHVQVIVQKGENLLIKGKNGTNNAFVVIELGKESYRTSIKDKSGKSVTWNEECELKIPKMGNTASIILTAYHRNNLGLDQFLGMVKIPLASFENLERSVEWYKLEGKPGKEKKNDKVRGELVLEISFVTKPQSQSLTSLQSKEKSSFDKLTGSLFGLSYGGGKKGVKKFANTLSRAVLKKKKKEETCPETLDNNDNQVNNRIKNYDNLDPGVVSDEEDSTSHKSSESLGDIIENETLRTIPPPKPQRAFLKNPQISVSHWEEGTKTKSSSYLNISVDNLSTTGSRKQSPKLEDRQRRLSDRRLSSSCVDFSHLSTPKPEKKFSSSFNLEKTPGESHKRLSKLAKKLKSFHSVDKLSKKENRKTLPGSEDSLRVGEDLVFPKSEIKNKNKDELVNMVVDLQKRVNCISHRVKDLEDYLDHILVKVMDTVPKILEKS